MEIEKMFVKGHVYICKRFKREALSYAGEWLIA